VGLKPFVKILPTLGTPGATVMILGDNLTDTTKVRFNGIEAKEFTVVSGTEITATVPTGAATGAIEVETPSGTLNSNEAFVVTPSITR
jgi:hypothetical protein